MSRRSRFSVVAKPVPPYLPSCSANTAASADLAILLAILLATVIFGVKLEAVSHDAAPVVFEAYAAPGPGDEAVRDHVSHHPAPDTAARCIDRRILQPPCAVARPVMGGLRRLHVRLGFRIGDLLWALEMREIEESCSIVQAGRLVGDVRV